MSEAQLQNELEALIHKHASWLDGRTWQRITQQMAEGHFERCDLMSLFDPEAFLEALKTELEG